MFFRFCDAAIQLNPLHRNGRAHGTQDYGKKVSVAAYSVHFVLIGQREFRCLMCS